LDYFKRLHIEAVTLNAGGAVAFYPTQVPFHYRSKWLGKMDTFGDLQKNCRALGMVVVARTDAHACHQDVYEAHPDWIMVDANGNKVRHLSDKDFWLTCALGQYNFEFLTAVHEEIMTKYMVDGIFTNAGRDRACVTARTAKRIFAPSAAWTCHARITHRIRHGVSTSCGVNSGCSSFGGCGMTESNTSIPMQAISPTQAAAR
jgi:hypothetical protein